jgi:sialate O-acetylesterase
VKYEIILQEGPVSYRVYQRSQDGTAAFSIEGLVTPKIDGILICSVFSNSSNSLVSHKLLLCDQGVFEGATDNLPVGYYTVSLELQNSEKKSICSKTINEVAVGDLYVLAGQSNMEGVGKLTGLEKPSENVRCFYFNDTWDIAKDPLCWFNESVDPVHWRVSPEQRRVAAENERYTRNSGAGLGVAFGKELYKYNIVPVGLIVCPLGGTSMEEWDPGKLVSGGASLYGALIRRVKKVGGKVKALLWYQGESDASEQSAPFFKKKFSTFIKALRKDLQEPQLPILYVQLASAIGEWIPEACPQWNFIQNEQLLIENDHTNIAMAAAIDSTFADSIHIDTASQRILGRRLALLAKRLCFNDFTKEIGPRPKEIRFEDEKRTLLRIVYENVNNCLKNEPKIFGFSVDSNDMNIVITECRIDKDNKSSILLKFKEGVPEKSRLWYGKGVLNVVCNLKDSANMAAPFFGPIEI